MFSIMLPMFVIMLPMFIITLPMFIIMLPMQLPTFSFFFFFFFCCMPFQSFCSVYKHQIGPVGTNTVFCYYPAHAAQAG